jgi:penicillin amidase
VSLDPAVEAKAPKEEAKAPDHAIVATRSSQRPRRTLRTINLFAALLVSAALLYVSFVGAGSALPALGPTFNPTTGAWTMASDAANPVNETLAISGLEQPVRVTLEQDGTAHIVAQTDPDLFLAIGYVHARFRLFQMDLMRR